MKTAPFCGSMALAHEKIYKAIEAFAQQCDSRQWPLAGVELGRIEELSNHLANVSRLCRDALWDESNKEG